MLIDILQELFNAREAGNEQEAEKYYRALEHYGMDRMTADEVLKAGRKFFGRETDAK